MASSKGFGRQFAKGVDIASATATFFADQNLAAEKAHEWMAEQTEADWKELVSGTLSPQQTKGAFARGSTAAVSTKFGMRRGLTVAQVRKRNLGGVMRAGQLPLLPINVQSGRLLNSIRKRKILAFARQSYDVGPDSSAGNSIWVLVPTGTRKMVARGIWDEIERRWKAREKAFEDHYKAKGQAVYS
jgi:hypothetical protein